MTTQIITTTSPDYPSTSYQRTVSPNATIMKSSFSYTASSSASCPISDAHSSENCRPMICQGMSPEARRIFSSSVPSAHVLAAFERCLHGNRSKENVKIWVGFHENFVEPLIKDTALRWVAPVPSDQIDECRGDDQNQIDVSAKAKRRHPFGLDNPPNSVWAAYARLRYNELKRVDPVIVQRDQEIVEAFSADSGYYAEGSGKQDLNVKRFKVRRLSFTKQLAELQKQKR